jgi:hypothetical protein
VAVPWLEVMRLPKTSFNCSVQMEMLEPSALSDEGPHVSADLAIERSAVVVVIGWAVPETEPSFAVTACDTAASVLTVKVTVARPLPSVMLVGDEKEPPFVVDHATVRPDSSTELSCASVSCAVIITVEPAGCVYELEVTAYLAGEPATKDTVWLPVVIAPPLSVAPIVALPRAAGAVRVPV